MDHLWSPWRFKYIMDTAVRSDCVFCTIPAESTDEKNCVLFRGKFNFVILNIFPYTSGHLMVVPYAHTASLADIDEATTSEMMELSKRALKALEAEYKPQGFNLGINLGSAAGAGIAEHMHFHVVPRWSGDGNFMTVVAETRVLPEILVETYTRLHKYFC
jgi:ATP adenylyltransferase